VYVTGCTQTSSGIASSGSWQSSLSGVIDVFLVKFSPTGTRLWGTYFGGTTYDWGFGLAADRIGNTYITGATLSTSGIASNNAHLTSYAGGAQDGFIAKFDSAGGRVWSTYYGGAGADGLNSITLDKQSNLLLVGSTSSSSGIATTGAFKTSPSPIFITKFDSIGSRQWGTYFGGGGSYGIPYITSDTSNNILISGSTNSNSGIATTNTFMPSAYYLTSGSNYKDIYIAKFNTFGIQLWGTYYGDWGNDIVQSITTDGFNNNFITGNSYSTINMATTTSFQSQCLGAGPFLAAFTSDGNLVNIKNNTISSNQTICSRSKPDTLRGSFPIGVMVGATQYKWLSSIIDSNSGFVTATAKNDTFFYVSPDITFTTWFRRVVISGNKYDTSAAVQITVLPKPFGGFTINNPEQCLSSNYFSFNDTTNFNSGNYTRKWYLGTGIYDTSIIINPNKTYTAIGYYQVKLVLTPNFGCTDSVIKSVGVGLKPIPDFYINNSSQCINGNVFIFNDISFVSSGILSRIWNFGTSANDTSASINPSKVYSSSGTYYVKLISSSYGCKDSITKTTTVFPKPTVGFTVNNSTQCLNINNFLFTDTSTISSGNFTRLWRLSTSVNDTSSLGNINKVYLYPEIYYPKLIITSNNGCKDSVTKTIRVNQSPIPNFSINDSIQILSGNSFSFINTSSAYNYVYWFLGDTFAVYSFGSIPVVRTYSVSAAYDIKLKVFGGTNGCIDSIIKPIKILPNRPTISASNLIFSNLTNTSMTISWTNGNGQRRLVLAKASVAVNANPVNGTSYTANTQFSNGSQIGAGNYVVYNGTGNSFTLTGLSPIITYYFAVVEFNGDSNLNSYQSTPYLTGNQSTLPVKWLDFTAKQIDENSILLNWQTASEINNSHFEVERTINNPELSESWEMLGKVEGNGNVNTISYYSYLDAASLSLSKGASFVSTTDKIYYRPEFDTVIL